MIVDPRKEKWLRTKSLFCVPCKVSLALKKVKPIKRPERMFKAIFDIKYVGSLQ